MKLVERDYQVLKELERWRFLLGRHITTICGFSSARTADRRLQKLTCGKYIERKNILYGTPGLYTITHKGRVLIGASKKSDTIRIDRIRHDIIMLDVVAYLMKKYNLKSENFTTEKELHKKDGFNNTNHHPDFVYSSNNKTIAFEIELTPKSKARMEKVLKANFLEYDVQNWIIEKTNNNRIKVMLDTFYSEYPNIRISYVEELSL